MFSHRSFACLFLTSLLPLSIFAQNLVENSGFESGDAGWSVFVPAESVAQAPVFTVVSSGARAGRSAARLASATPTRFAIAPRSILVNHGERYRLAMWYRAEPGAVVNPGTPGVLLRATFTSAPDATAPAANLHIGPGGDISTNSGREIAVSALAEKWTRISAVIEVPPGATRLNPNVFIWGLGGAVLVDDVVVEPVSANTPVTPLVAAATASAKPVKLAPAAPLKPGEERVLALANPGFEAGLDGWTTGGDNGMSSASSAAARGTGKGLRIDDIDTGKGSSLHGNYLPAAAGRTYRLRFWARSVEGDAEGAAVYLRFYDADFKLLTSQELGSENLFSIPASPGRFRQFTHEAVAPAGTAAVRVWIHSFTTSVITIDLDDLVLTESQH
ncbi:MAG: hypothetical protein WC205_12670 [Opitutaceae bacterium]|jgi:hypothetical protein